MSTTEVKTGIASALAIISVFFGDIFVKVFGMLIVFAVFVCLDIITGLVKAGKNGGLDSKKGFSGLMKKGLYLFVIIVAVGLDFLITYSAKQMGFDGFTSGFVTVLATTWLIVNEGISILENLGAIGVPFPGFLSKILKSMKGKVESQVKIDDGEDKSDE